MKDIKLNSLHDLDIVNGDLQIISDADELTQSLKIRLQVFLSEWFLDNTLGVDFFNTVFVKKPDLSLIASIFKQEILLEPQISSIDTFEISFSNNTRELFIEFSVNTKFYGMLYFNEGFTL